MNAKQLEALKEYVRAAARYEAANLDNPEFCSGERRGMDKAEEVLDAAFAEPEAPAAPAFDISKFTVLEGRFDNQPALFACANCGNTPTAYALLPSDYMLRRTVESVVAVYDAKDAQTIPVRLLNWLVLPPRARFAVREERGGIHVQKQIHVWTN